MTTPASLQSVDGDATDARAWTEAADPIDARVLARVVAPVLDVGCGPGRHVVALAASGVVALGIDVSPAALGLARARGASVLERSIFGRIPCAGRWRTALLLDGNIGIGADPAALLLRTRELLDARRGRVLVETAPPETRAVTRTVRLEIGSHAGPWFDLAVVGIDAMPDLARRTGFGVTQSWNDHDRWFVCLERTPT